MLQEDPMNEEDNDQVLSILRIRRMNQADGERRQHPLNEEEEVSLRDI